MTRLTTMLAVLLSASALAAQPPAEEPPPAEDLPPMESEVDVPAPPTPPPAQTSAAEVGTARPVGAYAGVTPGQPQPPPAMGRVSRRQQRRPRSVILTWPGFAMRPDGGSRFFVQMTTPVAPEVQAEDNRVVVLFPGTTVHHRNSARWLETRFFNTPVVRARLERRGRDRALVLYLRSPVRPSVRSEAAPGGSFHYVYVDFGPGNYVERPAAVIGPSSAPANQPGQAPLRDMDPALENEAPPPVNLDD